MSDRITAYKAVKVLEAVNLVELVSEYVNLSHSLRGKCPLHDGKGDNFALFPHEKPTLWTCHSQCGSGNAIAFIEQKLGMTNEQAINYLFDKLKLEMPRPKELKLAPKTFYSKRLADFCRWAHGNVSQVADIWRVWGWTQAMVNEWQIGYNPKPLWVDMGLDKKVYLAQGVVFPHCREGEYLWANVRRLDGQMPKYLGLSGGRRGLFGVDKWHMGNRTLIITEGEKDCISGHFIAGDLVNWACMGGSKAKPDAWDSLYLSRHKRIITLYDNDKSGIEGAAAMGFERMFLPKGGDLTNYLAAHGREASRQMIQKLVGGSENAKADDLPTADDLAWLAWVNDIRATVYPSNKVGKAMAVYAPIKAEQAELFPQATITNYEYA